MDKWHSALGAVGSFQVGVPGAGVLDFRIGDEEIWYLSELGDEVRFRNHPLVHAAPFIEFKHLGSTVLLGTDTGRIVYRFDPTGQCFEVGVELARIDPADRAFTSLRFIDVPGAAILSYENGLACFELNGALRWHFAHGDPLRRLLRVEPDRLVYQDEDGNLWSYAIRDGREDRI